MPKNLIKKIKLEQIRYRNAQNPSVENRKRRVMKNKLARQYWKTVSMERS